MQNSGRVNFGSKIGAILAAAGSAVGLGNIWRFPYEAGNHGGAAFILIYLACVLLMGMPIMIAEFTVGRRAKASTGRAFSVLAPGTQWKWIGFLGVLAGLLILGYYLVVAGWTLEYILQTITNGTVQQQPEDFVNAFQNFSQDPFRPVLWLLVFLFTNYVSLASMIGGCCFPVFVLTYSSGLWSRTNDISVTFIIFSFVVAGLLLWSHRKNIERLKNGTESKIYIWKKPAPKDKK